MNEQELRSLVRAAVARHLGTGEPLVRQAAAVHPPQATSPAPVRFASHTLHAGLVNIGDACVIEPAVSCDHCGYCKAHGH